MFNQAWSILSQNLTIFLIFNGILGLLMGSLASMLSYRLPRQMEENFWKQWHNLTLSRSQCPHCQHVLSAWQLIPLFSYLFNRGRCHYCGHKISPRYPLIEALNSGLFLWIAWVTYPQPDLYLASLILGYGLLLIGIIDWETQLILDNLSLPLLWMGLIANFYWQWVDFEQSLWGAILGYLSLWLVYQVHLRITGREGMGYGDFKLFAALGAWVGANLLPQVILLAALAALITTLGQILAQKLKPKLTASLPFGPFLALGGWLSWLYGDFLQNFLG